MLRTLLTIALLVPLAASAREWKVDPAKSTLTFKGTYQGEAFDGRFRKFDASIAYDPGDLSTAKFDVTVQLTSVDTGSSERDDTLATSDFFDTGAHPTAHFVTESFAKTASGVEAKGKLRIRDKTQPVTLDVTFAASGDHATLDVATTLKREAFGLGTSSDWADIGQDVPVQGHLEMAAK